MEICTIVYIQLLGAIQFGMITRLFNIITIGALLLFILFVTAFFFLGSQETFESQLNNLSKYFFSRVAGGMVIGLLGCVIIGVGNFLLVRKTETNRLHKVYRIVLLTLVLSTFTSIIGTTIFFYY